MLENFDAEPLDAPQDEEYALSRLNLHRFGEIAKWSRFAGLGTLVLLGTFVLIFLFLLIQSGESFSSMIDAVSYNAGFQEWLSILVMIAYFVVGIVVGFKLLSLGKKAEKAVATGTSAHMEFALEELNSFYKIIGIIFAISLFWTVLGWLLDAIS